MLPDQAAMGAEDVAARGSHRREWRLGFDAATAELRAANRSISVVIVVIAVFLLPSFLGYLARAKLKIDSLSIFPLAPNFASFDALTAGARLDLRWGERREFSLLPSANGRP